MIGAQCGYQMAPSFVPVGVAATTPHQAKSVCAQQMCVQIADMLKELVT